MAASLPILFFLLTLVVFVCCRPQDDLRKSFLNAAVVWGLIVAGLTEGLSLFGLLTATAVKVSWIVAVFAAAGVALQSWRSGEGRTWDWVRLPPLEIVLCALIGGILAVTAAIALMAPPNNWDSMTSHLARVAHWIQDRDLTFYPTPFHPQLHNPPWAEYAILHLCSSPAATASPTWCSGSAWRAVSSSSAGSPGSSGRTGAARRRAVSSARRCR
jgi:hypothetical protein